MENPFTGRNTTRLKLVLPVSRKQAWRLIATPRGLASWFPTSCKGRIAVGKTLQFGWPSGETESFRVLRVKKGESWQMDWWKLGRVRYSVAGGNPTIFTLEVRYPKKGEGKTWQVPELVGWSFFLSNLKSAAMKGRDLRNKTAKFSWKKGFID